MNELAQWEVARRLFKRFHERDPVEQRREIIKVGGLVTPTVALEVGPAVGLSYKALGDGKDYFHEFSKTNRPLVYVNSDGRQIYILEGGYEFTERGFLR